MSFESLSYLIESLKNDLPILNGSTKIVLAIDSLDELLQLEVRTRALNLISYKVVDAGLTQVKIGSTTALAIGPNPSSSIDEITMHLKLLR